MQSFFRPCRLSSLLHVTLLALLAVFSAMAASALPANAQSLTMSPATGSELPAGWEGLSYSTTISASGGSGSYEFTATGQNGLPPGLTLHPSTGVLSGTPEGPWSSSYLVVVQVADANDSSVTASATYRVPIGGFSTLPEGTVGVEYAGARLTATTDDYLPDYGSLPPGLTVTVTGPRAILGGVPTEAGTYEFRYTGGSRYKLVVQPAPVPDLRSVSPVEGPVSGGADVVITGEKLSGVTAVTFGGQSAAFAVDSDTQITATAPPHAAGSVDIAATAPGGTDTLARAYTYLDKALVLSPSGGALPQGMVGEDYAVALSTSGGRAPYVYSLAGGTLPDGVALHPTEPELSGVPAPGSEGSYSFTLRTEDADGFTATAALTLKVVERAVTVADKRVDVALGATPPNVNLAEGATGGPFLSGEVVAVEPPWAGAASIVNGEFAQASFDAPLGWYLKFVPAPDYSGRAVVRYRLTGEIGASDTGTVTYDIGHDIDEVAAEMDALVRGFVETRQSLIASSIATPGLLERRRMAAAAAPAAMGFAPSGDGMTMNFASSLLQAQSAAADAAEGLAAATPFNLWVDGTLIAHDRNDGRWGGFGMVSAGADYLISDRALVGVSFHYDRMTDPTDADATLTGDGWLAGPYASFEVGAGVFWDTRLLYGGSSNDIDTPDWDGAFDTRRWLFDTSVAGEWRLSEDTTFSPRLRTVYFSETVGDYRVGNGSAVVEVDGFTAEQLRVSLGGEFARRLLLDDGATLTPRLGLAAGFAGLDGSGVFGQATAGFQYRTTGAWTLDGALLSDFEENGLAALGARLGVAMRF